MRRYASDFCAGVPPIALNVRTSFYVLLSASCSVNFSVICVSDFLEMYTFIPGPRVHANLGFTIQHAYRDLEVRDKMARAMRPGIDL